jgi:hypothetical protein
VPSKKSPPHTYALISLGCPKNLVDSERMAGLLQREGYRMVADPAGAETVVINTCGFIGDARTESYRTIEEMLRLKQRGRVQRVVVAGCLAERDREALLDRYPQIDRLIGVFARDEIAEACGAGVPPALRPEKGDSPHLCEAPSGRAPTEGWSRQMGTVPFFPPTAAELAAYCSRLEEILAAGGRIKLVQVHTIARPPAEAWVSALADAEVDAIAELVRHRTGLPVAAFYGSS